MVRARARGARLYREEKRYPEFDCARARHDDFGAGQARLLELVEVPASYLKFDISLIHEIDKASVAPRELVALLLELARKMSIATLAEGISRVEEMEVCRDLGFEYFQGYYFGRPAPGLLEAQV